MRPAWRLVRPATLVVRCSGTEIGFPYVGPVEGYPCITGAGRLPEREHLAAWRASRAARVEAPGCGVLCALWRRGSAPPSPTFRAPWKWCPRRPGEPAERYAEPPMRGSPRVHPL